MPTNSTKIPNVFEPVEDIGSMRDDGPCDDDKAVLTFEVSRGLYGRVRPLFDKIIGQYDLPCHVRFEERA